MKAKIFLYALASAIAVMATGCSDDKDDISVDKIPTDVKNTMQQMFPHVYSASWEHIYPYYVADFMNSGFETNAWFNADGAWSMTETDYNSNIAYLPAAVQRAFAQSQYGQWIVDSVDAYQRTYDSFYVIEVETPSSSDITLFYSNDGILLNEAENFDITITPNTIISVV